MFIYVVWCQKRMRIIVYHLTGLRYIESRSGKPLILFNNYTYYMGKRSNKPGVSFWRCSTHASKGCTARIVMCEGVAVKANWNHNHLTGKMYWWTVQPVGDFEVSIFKIYDAKAGVRIKNLSFRSRWVFHSFIHSWIHSSIHVLIDLTISHD